MFQTEDNCEEKAATRCRRDMTMNKCYRLGIDIGSTTVKIAVLDDENHFLFSDYERHFANIQETLADLLTKAVDKLGPIDIYPVITGSGGLTLALYLEELERAIEQLRREEPEKKRLCWGLGILGGLFLAVVLM